MLSAEAILEPGPPRKIATKELTSEPKSDALSKPCENTREGSMWHLAPRDIFRYQKEADQPQFSTLGELIKEASWGDTWYIRILDQEETL